MEDAFVGDDETRAVVSRSLGVWRHWRASKMESNIPSAPLQNIDTSSEDGVSTLGVALGKMPDGETTSTVNVEVHLNNFTDISLEAHILTHHMDGTIDSGFHENVRDFVRTKLAHKTFSCMCGNFTCTERFAIDMIGVRQIDKSDGGWRRGYSPIVLLNGTSTNEQPLDCLAGFSLALSQIRMQGCDLADCNTSKCPVASHHESLGLPRQPLYVENCINGSIESLRILNNATGAVIGRAITGRELLPNQDDPSETVRDYFLPSDLELPLNIDEEVKIGPFRLIGEISIPIKFEYDLGPLINDFGDELVDGLFRSQMPNEFPEDHPASEAKAHDAIRVLMSYSNERLLVSTKRPSKLFNDSSRLSLDSELYRDLIGARPESSPVPELLTGVVLLSATSCALGYTIGCLRKESRPWYRRFLLSPSFWGSFLAFGVEFTAFCLRWNDEREQNAYAESMLRYDVIGGGYFGGLAPLRVGRETNLFTVNAYVAEISDASRNYEPIFVVGVVAMVLSFAIAAHNGWKTNKPVEEEDSHEDVRGSSLAILAAIPTTSVTSSDEETQEQSSDEVDEEFSV